MHTVVPERQQQRDKNYKGRVEGSVSPKRSTVTHAIRKDKSQRYCVESTLNLEVIHTALNCSANLTCMH